MMRPTILRRRRELILGMLLAAATLAVYWPVRTHEFVNFDDQEFVTQNVYVRQGFTRPGIVYAFTGTCAGNWHPLTILSHMLDVECYGFKAGCHHMTSALLHVCNALLLFLLLRGMTDAVGRSAFVAGLFALHPLHVESVAWVAERKDVLSTLFWLLALLAYRWYTARPSRRRYLAVLAPFVLGLMAKPMLVTLPFVLLLLDYWPLGRMQLSQSGASDLFRLLGTGLRENRRLLIEKIPLFILAIGTAVLTLFVQHHSDAIKGLTVYPLAVRTGNALLSYWLYIWKAVLPRHLAVFYPHPGADLSALQVAGAALALAAVSAGVVRFARRHPYLATGWLWYLGALVPVIGIVQVGGQAMADRYTYVPLIGIYVMLAWGVPALLRARPGLARHLPSIALVLLLAHAYGTSMQLRHWRNSITLWERALAATPANEQAHNNLGTALDDAGRPEAAMRHYQAALRIDPRSVLALNNVGLAFAARGDHRAAIRQYSRALAIRPDYAGAHNSLSVSLVQSGRPAEAEVHSQAAVRLMPDWPEARVNLANVLILRGREQEALTQFSEALRLHPGHIGVLRNLAVGLARQGKANEALAHFSQILARTPRSAQAHHMLGVALARFGRDGQAAAHFEAALALDPALREARDSLQRLRTK